MRRSFIYLSIALLLTAILIIYHQLGGFKDPDITFIENEEYKIAGYYYEGDLKDDAWENLFLNTRKKINDGILAGILTIVWYEEPEGKGNSKAFIGVIFEGNPSIPGDMEVRHLNMHGVIRATLESHVLVMPEPQKVVRNIQAYAEKNNFELQDILIEKYPEESKIFAEIPVK